MAIPIIDEKTIFEKLIVRKNPFFEEYYAFYSSWYGGIVKNPSMMLVPVDDHLVHRGDGVFEGIKAIGRSIYLLNEHLERLFTSAENIALNHSFSFDKLKAVIIETLRAANQDEAMIRVFLSRGPGNFSVNPYDSIEPQLYVIIHRLIPPANEKYQQGVVIGKSDIDVKSSWMARIKSCNYLPNVMMKKEAVDRQLDFVIATDGQGNITESATENIMIIDNEGAVVHPEFDYILKGITMMRVCELARENGFKTKIKPISLEELQSAREVIITGTSLNVLPVVKFENQKICNGKPGPMAKKLNELILNDIRAGTKGTRV